VNGDGVLLVIRFGGRSVCHVRVPGVVQRGSGGGYGRLETADGDNSDDTSWTILPLHGRENSENKTEEQGLQIRGRRRRRGNWKPRNRAPIAAAARNSGEKNWQPGGVKI
jgi:hypothetical protein